MYCFIYIIHMMIVKIIYLQVFMEIILSFIIEI